MDQDDMFPPDEAQELAKVEWYKEWYKRWGAKMKKWKTIQEKPKVDPEETENEDENETEKEKEARKKKKEKEMEKDRKDWEEMEKEQVDMENEREEQEDAWTPFRVNTLPTEGQIIGILLR